MPLSFASGPVDDSKADPRKFPAWTISSLEGSTGGPGVITPPSGTGVVDELRVPIQQREQDAQLLNGQHNRKHDACERPGKLELVVKHHPHTHACHRLELHDASA